MFKTLGLLLLLLVLLLQLLLLLFDVKHFNVLLFRLLKLALCEARLYLIEQAYVFDSA